LQPQVLIFDEPTAQLDPIARKELLQMIYQLNFEMNITIIMSEHMLDEVVNYANRIMYLEEGVIHYDLSAREFCELIRKPGHDTIYHYFPQVSTIISAFESDSTRVPISVKEGRELIYSVMDETIYESNNGIKALVNNTTQNVRENRKLILELKKAYFTYHKKSDFVLKNISIELYDHEILAVMGANGSGKTTLLKCLTGQLALQRGRLSYNGKSMKGKTQFTEMKRHIGYVAQNTMVHFSQHSLADELLVAFNDNDADKVFRDELIELFELGNLMDHHPYDLSGGEQEKLAILLALAKRPQVLLLDEPTKGLDPLSKIHLANILREISNTHATIVCVTHDIEFAARYSDRATLLFDHEIAYDGLSSHFFSENHYYTTKINQVMKPMNDKCILLEDVIEWKKSL
jgi:energy-coupling factor transport system ATP-binding protein